MAATTADVHLKRAYGFLQEVEKATEEFRRRAIEYDAQLEADEPFLQGMVGSFRGAKQLKQQKASLVGDLQLAAQEVEKAAVLDQNATIVTPDGSLGITLIRAMIAFMHGQVEMIYGTGDNAKLFFNNCLQIAELPDAHYMFGLLYESEYKPAEALRHFERYLELDPNGELSVSALREANAMKNYKVRFRGSWGTFLILFLFCFPAAPIYFFVQRK